MLYRFYIDGGIIVALTISPKYQVVIPKLIRDKLRLSPGQKMQAIMYNNRIELIPVQSIKDLLADSIILAMARTCEATIWTQDEDFKSLEGVQFRKKRG